MDQATGDTARDGPPELTADAHKRMVQEMELMKAEISYLKMELELKNFKEEID